MDVQEIESSYKAGETFEAIARKQGVSRQRIHQIVKASGYHEQHISFDHTPTVSRGLAKIPVSAELFAVIDLADFEKVAPHPWHLAGDPIYTFYATTDIDGESVRMHRLIMGLGSRGDDPELIDHRDWNGLNNRRENLRICDSSQNGGNRRANREDRQWSRFKGVTLSPRRNRKRWIARITKDQRRFDLGLFLTEEEAATAYDQAAKRLFADFAMTNHMLGLFDAERSLGQERALVLRKLGG